MGVGSDVLMVSSASQESTTLHSGPRAFHPEGHSQFTKQGVPIANECFLEKAFCSGKCYILVPGNYKSLFKKCWNCWSVVSFKITGVTLSSVCYMSSGPSSVTK